MAAATSRRPLRRKSTVLPLRSTARYKYTHLPRIFTYVNDAVLIHGTPQIVLHALDPDEHLIHVPLVPGSWSAKPQAVCEGLAKLLAPSTNRLVRDNSATLSQKQLDIPEADAEHMVQPDSMADDLGGKAVAIVRIGRRLHAATLAGLQLVCQTRLP